MTLRRDDIVGASLLKPIGEEHGTSSTLEEEAALLGEEIETPQIPGSLPEWPEIPRSVEPAEQSTTPNASFPSPIAPTQLPSFWEGQEIPARDESQS